MLNNRQQSGRRRGRGGQRQQGNGRDNGNRIDNRARGNAPQMLEKYKTLARDSQLSGDRVMTEYYLQFADHYFRVVAESRARFEENRRQRDDWQGDEGYEGEEQNLDQGAEGYADDGQDEDRPQQQQPRRDVRERNDRDYNRDANSGNRDNRDNNRDRGERDGNRQRYANDRNGSGDRNGNRFNGNRAREEEEERPETGGIDIAVLPPAFASDGPMTPIDIDEPEAAPAPAKPRRGRPRKAAPEAEAGSEG